MRYNYKWFVQQTLDVKATIITGAASIAAGPLAFITYETVIAMTGTPTPWHPDTGFQATTLAEQTMAASMITMTVSPMILAICITALGIIKLCSPPPSLRSTPRMSASIAAIRQRRSAGTQNITNQG